MSNLEGLSFYGDYTIDDYVNKNVMSFIRYGLLEIGAFYNLQVGVTRDGVDQGLLTPQVIHGVTNNTVFRGWKPDWIWESNIPLKYDGGQQPLVPSGILINSTFYPTGSVLPNGSGYYIDFSRGQVVMGLPLTSGVVRTSYSVRVVGVYDIDGPEYSRLSYEWRDRSSNPSGSYDNSAQSYLPAIFCGVQSFNTIRGLEIGSRAKLSEAKIQLHLVAANSFEQKKLGDIAYFLETKSFPLYDINNDVKALNARGELVNPSGIWSNLIVNYTNGGTARFMENSKTTKITNILPPIKYSLSRIGLELELFPS